ncbi:hypothetical protein PV325_011858 [Microctonus aethiopoides]|uniref:Zinc carboxypeptidase A 1 n=1 Tax=Microctonus aethiopoides TaxID=144406 RepID=A0AA39FYN6_9HYME|nr:hypothetical protein PV325_011858 [Microctonus aethiopoides]KAK0177634.1 hypothetical protein PV328_001668 [Microctonus aethiopoides]
MLKIGIFVVILAWATANQIRYDNYKVFKIFPKNEMQINLLYQLSEYSNEYSFWHEPSFINDTVDVMIGPEKLMQFEDLMNSKKIKYEILIENVQELIDNENPQRSKILYASDFDWESYHTLEEIYVWLDSLSEKYPDNVEVIIGGTTHEGREIKGVKLSFKENNPKVFIEGNIHAREWITSATVTFIINELLTSENPDVRKLAEKNDWYIFPIVNPDGFVYSHNKQRLWRKSRKPYSRFCSGTDLNRNWGYKWNQGGASGYPCSETYRGPKAFSDNETKSLSEFITSISDNLYAYISFHSYSQLLLFPYGHSTDHLDNHDQLKSIGEKTINALSKRYGTKYVTGNIAETIYIATGSSMDWVKANYKVPISYTYELRDKGKYGFLLPANQIIPTGEETLDSLVELFNAADELGIPNRP